MKWAIVAKTLSEKHVAQQLRPALWSYVVASERTRFQPPGKGRQLLMLQLEAGVLRVERH
jgi:hypothetical protein